MYASSYAHRHSLSEANVCIFKLEDLELNHSYHAVFTRKKKKKEEKLIKVSNVLKCC